jgi:hypothetical protein
MNRSRLLIAFIILSTASVWGQDSNPAGEISLNGVWKYQPIARTTLKTWIRRENSW